MNKPTVYVIYHSTYGHLKTLADTIVEGLKATDLVNIEVRQFEETLPQEVLEKMHALPQDKTVPFVTLEDMEKADAFLFGIPTRFGTMGSQVKTFLDSTGGLWAKKALVGKMAGVFVGTGSQSGGQESTTLSFIPMLAHHGMIFVPMGFTHENLFCVDEIVGGSPYGAGSIAPKSSVRPVSDKEKEIAFHQGESFSIIVSKYHK
ncbi:NAD(P)H dehydrogenase (quinone) FQR1 [Smittium mucronatum]|uniref:NAD(P)H dehydrogenase (Quinone) FQR1 n=1 Tax=Smittium mucronatum TaxID=133383 RepID=A0A1R0GQ15_9FUNG|nr:NAD(P)H dehydrogenase (quinone) FQR1 [Smittium mucronatum]